MELYWFLGGVLFISLVLGWSLLARNKIFLPCILASLAILLVRLVPMQYPTMVWWGDPHYYFIGTRGVIEANNLNLNQEFMLWYPQAQRQVTWFVLHLQTVSIIKILGIENLNTAMRFVPSVFGILTFLVLISVYKFYLQTNWAIYAAYFTSMMDVIVFYQTEYHEQGIGFALSIFLLYVVLKFSRGDFSDRSGILVLLMIIFAFTGSHHFSGIIFSIIVSIFIFSTYIGAFIWNRTSFNAPFKSMFYLAILIFLPTAIIHLFVSTNVLSTIAVSTYEVMTNTVISSRPSRGTRFMSDPTLVNFLPTLLKSTFVLISIYSISSGIFREEYVLYRELSLLLGSIGILALGTFLSGFDVITRFILFGYVPLLALVMMAFKDLVEYSNKYRCIFLLGVISFVCVSIVISMTAAYPPSLVDSNTDIRADSYHGLEPVGYQGISAGKWVGSNIHNQPVSVTLYTHTSAHYYGQLDSQQVSYIRGQPVSGYQLLDSKRSDISLNSSILYSNGRYSFTESKYNR